MEYHIANVDITITIKDELILTQHVSLTICLMIKFDVNVQIKGDTDKNYLFLHPCIRKV